MLACVLTGMGRDGAQGRRSGSTPPAVASSCKTKRARSCGACPARSWRQARHRRRPAATDRRHGCKAAVGRQRRRIARPTRCLRRRRDAPLAARTAARRDHLLRAPSLSSATSSSSRPRSSSALARSTSSRAGCCRSLATPASTMSGRRRPAARQSRRRAASADRRGDDNERDVVLPRPRPVQCALAGDRARTVQAASHQPSPDRSGRRHARPVRSHTASRCRCSTTRLITSDWQVDVLATDINGDVLERARRARYSQLEVNRGLPVIPARSPLRTRRDRLAGRRGRPQLVRFSPLNLAEPFEVHQMDVVFLRNVLIYFDPATKVEVLRRVRAILRPDGFLFLGGAETTLGLDDGFERVAVGSHDRVPPEGRRPARAPASPCPRGCRRRPVRDGSRRRPASSCRLGSWAR